MKISGQVFAMQISSNLHQTIQKLFSINFHAPILCKKARVFLPLLHAVTEKHKRHRLLQARAFPAK